MKRSNAPIFWLLFGAGGMLSALLGSMLVFITGIAVPLGWPLAPTLLSYPRALALAQHWAGKGFVFVVIALFAWHAAHRIFHSCLLYTSPSPRDRTRSRMPSSA